MRLSEAIKLGAMLKPQGFKGDNVTHSCALRAATEALGIQDDCLVINYAALRQAYPLLNTWRQCPLCLYRDDTLAGIWHLNDDHKWTREAIAAWVATVEPAPDTTAVDPSAQHREGDPRATDLLSDGVFVRAAKG